VPPGLNSVRRAKFKPVADMDGFGVDKIRYQFYNIFITLDVYLYALLSPQQKIRQIRRSNMTEAQIKEHLRKNNDEFRRLEEKHHQYERQLEEISSHALLSPEQQREKKDIKKLKLKLKDKMQEMIIEFRSQLKE
jgi:uncharacterized protein YdcH (DUF465 family)